MNKQENDKGQSAKVEPKKDNGNRFPPEMLVAAFAVIISLSTLFVYIYQSNLMKQQQKMSVWPHLTIGPSVLDDDLTLRMMNQGIGPAIIEAVRIVHDERELGGINELMSIVPDSLQSPYRFSSLWPGQVIMAGEPVDLFSVNSSGAVGYLAGELSAGRILLEVCYSSVYGDSWVTNGLQVEERSCDL